jgi:hypothetical protein
MTPGESRAVATDYVLRNLALIRSHQPDMTLPYGTGAGPHLLGVSYHTAAQRAVAVRNLASEQGSDTGSLELIAATLEAVSQLSLEDFRKALYTVASTAIAMIEQVDRDLTEGSFGELDRRVGDRIQQAADAWGISRTEAKDRLHAGQPFPGADGTLYGIRPHRPVDDRKKEMFERAFPDYCADGSCGRCGACELRKDGG